YKTWLRQTNHPCDICGGPEQEHRLKVLFQVLDVNGDGGICVNDLIIGLKKLGENFGDRLGGATVRGIERVLKRNVWL
uniref:EF-hand domain-containing protein n=1 Tax=Amphilophus citrinellus TaxID=61819 RepID=A0A3Q0R8F6_AMPCI